MPFRRTYIWYILIALVVFGESMIPYLSAILKAPSGYHFAGQLTYTPDQNMYFSFISQAREGAFLLKDKLTAIPHEPVFVNLQFWLVGALQRMFSLSENGVYTLWRLLGVLMLSIGFGMLVGRTLNDNRRRVAAFALFLLSGGFGFVFALLSGLHIIGFNATQNGIIDMRYGLLPLQQIITNPNFAFPHGLLLIAYSLLIRAIQQSSRRHFVYAGLVFCLVGFVRPYDIIPPFVLLPLYVLATHWRSPGNWRAWVNYLIPLFMLVPVLGYNYWIFGVHPIFKYWSLQGHNAGVMPGPVWHYLAYGAVGVWAIVSAIQMRLGNVGKTGLFLVLWFGVTFIFIQMGRFIPAIGWSPQIGVYLFAPLTIAASSINIKDLAANAAVRRAVIVSSVLCVLAGNIAIVAYFSKPRNTGDKLAIFYNSDSMEGVLHWLNAHATKNDVVLADLAASQRVAKYTPAAVVAAHYSVTPRFAATYSLVETFMADSLFVKGEMKLPENLHVSMVLLHRPCMPSMGMYLRQLYCNNEYALYAVEKH